MYGTEVDKISESYVKASYGILVISLLIEVILPVIVYVDKSRAFPSGRIFKIPRRVIGIGKSGDPQQGNSRRGVVRDERDVYTIESSNSLRTSMTSLSEAETFKRFAYNDVPDPSMNSVGSINSINTRSTMYTNVSITDRISTESLV